FPDGRPHLESMARSGPGDPDILTLWMAVHDEVAVIAVFRLADAGGDDGLAPEARPSARHVILYLFPQEGGGHPLSIIRVHRHIAHLRGDLDPVIDVGCRIGFRIGDIGQVFPPIAMVADRGADIEYLAPGHANPVPQQSR